MTSGNCLYCGSYQADLEGHSQSFHHLPYIAPKITAVVPPTPKQEESLESNRPKIKGFCPECGQKLKSKWYIESFFLIMRYSFTAFWIGALAGAGWLLENGFHH